MHIRSVSWLIPAGLVLLGFGSQASETEVHGPYTETEGKHWFVDGSHCRKIHSTAVGNLACEDGVDDDYFRGVNGLDTLLSGPWRVVTTSWRTQKEGEEAHHDLSLKGAVDSGVISFDASLIETETTTLGNEFETELLVHAMIATGVQNPPIRYYISDDPVALSCGVADCSVEESANATYVVEFSTNEAFDEISTSGVVNSSSHPDFSKDGENLYFGFVIDHDLADLSACGAVCPRYVEPRWTIDNYAITLYGIDNDEDDVADSIDNCSEDANASQCDTDGDGFGNACDGDLDGDGFITGADNDEYFAAIEAFMVPPANPEADMNCDGFVTGADTPFYLDKITDFLPGPACQNPIGTPCP